MQARLVRLAPGGSLSPTRHLIPDGKVRDPPVDAEFVRRCDDQAARISRTDLALRHVERLCDEPADVAVCLDPADPAQHEEVVPREPTALALDCAPVRLDRSEVAASRPRSCSAVSTP